MNREIECPECESKDIILKQMSNRYKILLICNKCNATHLYALDPISIAVIEIKRG